MTGFLIFAATFLGTFVQLGRRLQVAPFALPLFRLGRQQLCTALPRSRCLVRRQSLAASVLVRLGLRVGQRDQRDQRDQCGGRCARPLISGHSVTTSDGWQSRRAAPGESARTRSPGARIEERVQDGGAVGAAGEQTLRSVALSGLESLRKFLFDPAQVLKRRAAAGIRRRGRSFGHCGGDGLGWLLFDLARAVVSYVDNRTAPMINT